MIKELKCIMLIDDNPDDNFIHERAIRKAGFRNTIIVKNSGRDALEYIKSRETLGSDLIFLDINMPGMNGWEFLEEYNRLNRESHTHEIIIMLTTSDNIKDVARSKTWSFISDYITKPLTKEIIKDIINKYFK